VIFRAALLLALLCPCARAAAISPRGCSPVVTDRYGGALRVFLSPGQSYSRPVSIDEVSPWLVLAALAAEDKRFFSHPGVDMRAALRALWQNASSGRTVSGASTITQQLARSLDPAPRTLGAKLRETLTALRLERKLSKREILESYFNSAPYGGNVYGVEAASRLYFGTSAAELSPAQAALLGGIPKSPVKYDPLAHFAAAAGRQRIVLRRMFDAGYINERIYTLALAEKLYIRHDARPFLAPQLALRAARLSPGLCSVKTTIDPQIQTYFQNLLKARIDKLSRQNVTNGAMVALDNRTGDILAWVASADFSDGRHGGQIDGVAALRQPGSALKPFVYALAFSKGWRASDIIDDSPAFFPGGFSPKNYDETFHGPVSLREALACSLNVPAVKLADRLGPPAILDALHKFGFASLDGPAEKYGLGIALGDGEVALAELAAAYCALARGGSLIEPGFIPASAPRPARRAIDPVSAYIVTDILSDNYARARAFTLDSPFNLPFAFAAKTGTSKDYRDNWAIGYTPEWTIAVWTGNFSGKPMRKVSGISGAGPVLGDAAAYMYSKRPSGEFAVPPGIKPAEVCSSTGKLPGLDCRQTRREVFSYKYPPDPAPAPEQSAARAVRRQMPSVDFPKNGDVFKIDPAAPRASQQIALKAAGLPGGAAARWIVDSKPADMWWPLKPGRHTARFIWTQDGKTAKSAPVGFTVLE